MYVIDHFMGRCDDEAAALSSQIVVALDQI